MKLSLGRLDVLIWVLIYGGLAVLLLGLALRHEGSLLSASFVPIGALAAAAGVVLIWVRSRVAAAERNGPSGTADPSDSSSRESKR